MTAPILGVSHDCFIRSIDWQEIVNGEILSRTALVFNGTEVHEGLTDTYFRALPRWEKAIATLQKAGVAPGYLFYLRNDADQAVGAGRLAATDDAPTLAWLTCFFLELNGLHLELAAPTGAASARLLKAAPLSPDARRRAEDLIKGRTP